MHFKTSSAIGFNLDQSINLSPGNGLRISDLLSTTRRSVHSISWQFVKEHSEVLKSFNYNHNCRLTAADNIEDNFDWLIYVRLNSIPNQLPISHQFSRSKLSLWSCQIAFGQVHDQHFGIR